MIERILKWLGYVPEADLLAVRFEAVRLRVDLEQVQVEVQETAIALREARRLADARIGKVAERLSPVVSLHRRPDEVSRYRFDLDIECDLLEKMVVDYRIEGSSADYELLMAGLTRRVRNSLDKLLKVN